MKKTIAFYKNLDSTNRVLLIGSCIVIILLVINFCMTLNYISMFSTKAQSGNDRWKQVEEIILDIKNNSDNLNYRLDIVEKKLEIK